MTKTINQLRHNVQKYRPVNAVTASFNTVLLWDKWPKHPSEKKAVSILPLATEPQLELFAN